MTIVGSILIFLTHNMGVVMLVISGCTLPIIKLVADEDDVYGVFLIIPWVAWSLVGLAMLFVQFGR